MEFLEFMFWLMFVEFHSISRRVAGRAGKYHDSVNFSFIDLVGLQEHGRTISRLSYAQYTTHIFSHSASTLLLCLCLSFLLSIFLVLLGNRDEMAKIALSSALPGVAVAPHGIAVRAEIRYPLMPPK